VLFNKQLDFTLKKQKLYIIHAYYFCNTMDTIQARIPKGLIREIDLLVDKGLYANKSDVVRDAVRRLAIKRMIGIIPNTGDSVKEIRKIRKKLSKEIKSFSDIEEINKLIE